MRPNFLKLGRCLQGLLRGRAVSTGFAAAVLLVTVAGPVQAIEPAADEEEALKACERRLCTMVLTQQAAGDDLSCRLAKTWDRDTLKGGEEKKVSWGFGDAQCKVALDVKRKDVISALTDKKAQIEIAPHTVNCQVERGGEVRPVTATLAPRLQFKDGRAQKIWIGLKEINGPADVKATVWMAAKLEDTLGIFHKSMLKSVNKFLHEKCAQRYFADGTPKPDPAERKKTAAKQAAEKKAAEQKPSASKATETSAAEKKASPSATGGKPETSLTQSPASPAEPARATTSQPTSAGSIKAAGSE